MMRRRRACVVCAAAMLAAGGVWAQPGAGPAAGTTTVGLEGRVVYRYRGPAIRARSVDEKAPLVVRIAGSGQDGEFVLYDIRYIAQRAGEFDVRDGLERVDGGSLADAPAIPVRVAALLAGDDDGELIEAPGAGPLRLGGYRAALIVAGAAWVLPVAVVVARRVRRRPAIAAPLGPRGPTLADQLRPLVEGAIGGELDEEGRARLEWLLLAHWRERLGLRGLEPVEALARIRADKEAGELLGAVERWLHWPPDTAASAAVDSAGLLRRYRDAPAIERAPGPVARNMQGAAP